jgi:hypothetical protein
VIVRLFFALAILLFQNQPQTPPHQKEAATPKSGESQPAQVSTIGTSVGSSNEKTPTRQTENGNTYDPRTDCLYRWYLRFTIIGVVGGFIGIGVLVWQAFLTRKSVEAAKKSADALMNAEQAILVVDKGEWEFDGTQNIFKWSIANSGKIVATVFAVNGSLQIGDSGELPPDVSVYDYRPVHERIEIIISPGSDNNPMWDIPLKPNKNISEIEREGVLGGTKYSWACGFYSYRDVFGRPFTQRFCYRWNSDNHSFYVGGPWEYRRLI